MERRLSHLQRDMQAKESHSTRCQGELRALQGSQGDPLAKFGAHMPKLVREIKKNACVRTHRATRVACARTDTWHARVHGGRGRMRTGAAGTRTGTACACAHMRGRGRMRAPPPEPPPPLPACMMRTCAQAPLQVPAGGAAGRAPEPQRQEVRRGGRGKRSGAFSVFQIGRH